MKKNLSYIINFIALLCIVGIFFGAITFVYNNNKVQAFALVFIILLIISIVKQKYEKNSSKKVKVLHFINGFIVGYKISLIIFVMTLGKEIFNLDTNFNTYFMCYIPSILYIFDSTNITEIIEFCNFEICS